MVLPSAPGNSFRFSSVKRWNRRCISRASSDQGVPRAVHGEIVAAGVEDGDLAPELRHRAQHFQLAGEELLVEHGKLHVLLDGVHAAQAHAEIVHIAAQHAPDGAALRAARERLHGGGGLAVVAGGGVAGQHDAFEREILASDSRCTCPDPANILAGVSGDQPTARLSRSFRPSSREIGVELVRPRRE